MKKVEVIGYYQAVCMDVLSWFRRRKTSRSQIEEDDEAEKLYGLTPTLISFIHSLTLETFKGFPLPPDVDEEGNVSRDLSDWQERHATLVLTKLKELAQLRFRLCPGYMKERKFWRIYFSLVRGYVSEYELRAVKLEKLQQMKMENGTSSDVSVYEVEMAEATRHHDMGAADSFD